jgi:restriction endonuclease S subunit
MSSSFQRSQLKENDILFSIAGALGRIAIVTNEILPANTNQALAIITLKPEVYPPYVFWSLKSGNVLDEIENLKVGVAQLNLSLQQITDFEIPLPPFEKQVSLVKDIEEVQSRIIKLKSK